MKLPRRTAVKAGLLTGFSAMLGGRLAQAASRKQRPFRQCVVLWMGGGPSQIETFAPGTDSIASNVPGIRLGTAAKEMATYADQLCLLRSVGGRQGEHERATTLLHTGFEPTPAFPRPSFGSMVADQRSTSGLPRYVTLGELAFGPAFLDTDAGPFLVGDLAQAKRQLERVRRREGAMELLQQLNARHLQLDPAGSHAAVQQRGASIESVHQLVSTGFSDALDITSASKTQREAFGDTPFGRRVLVASRLLELGVPVVEVQLSGWDTHVDNHRQVGKLCRELFPAWTTLMKHLQRSGRWDDTLIIWMGEFGRTPVVNGQGGRDHFPEVTPVVLAGGNLGGRVVGKTDPVSGNRIGEKHSVGDLMATLLTLMGLDTDTEYRTRFGSPTQMTDDGVAISGVLKGVV